MDQVYDIGCRRNPAAGPGSRRIPVAGLRGDENVSGIAARHPADGNARRAAIGAVALGAGCGIGGGCTVDFRGDGKTRLPVRPPHTSRAAINRQGHRLAVAGIVQRRGDAKVIRLALVYLHRRLSDAVVRAVGGDALGSVLGRLARRHGNRRALLPVRPLDGTGTARSRQRTRLIQRHRRRVRDDDRIGTASGLLFGEAVTGGVVGEGVGCLGEKVARKQH